MGVEQRTDNAQGLNSDVQLELYGDHGRIRLGPKLVPPIHAGATMAGEASTIWS